MSDQNGVLPPTPRATDEPTESELIPFKSGKINIWKSKALQPLLLTGLACVALFVLKFRFNSMESAYNYFNVLATFGVAAIFLGVYFYSGESKSWWWYLIPGVLCYWLFRFFPAYAYVFRDILPGGDVADDAGFFRTFISMFFAAGLCEELFKATPAILALLLAISLGGVIGQAAPGLREIFIGKASMAQIRGALALHGPLDGLLMGFAAGAAFILFETLFQYVPGEVERVTQATKNEFAGLTVGFMLLVPRVLQGVSGHMAWAGIFGYFLGLAACYPALALRLIAIGWLVPSTLHALWNSSGATPYPIAAWTVVTVVTIVLFVACLLKGKQLEFAWSGRASESDSIPVGAAPGMPVAPSPAAVASGSSASIGSVLGGVAKSLDALAGGALLRSAGTNAVPQPPSAPASASPVAARFSIGAGTQRFALEAGRVIDFAVLFGAMGAPAGASGEISQHPQDPTILGLRNTGSAAWTAISADGATITVPPGKNLRIAAGTRLILGPATLDIQTY